MRIIRNTPLEWLVNKSVIKLDDRLEHWLSQDRYTPEFRNGLQKLKNIPIGQILLKVLEIKFDDLSNLPEEFTLSDKHLQTFDEAIQKLSTTSNNTG